MYVLIVCHRKPFGMNSNFLQLAMWVRSLVQNGDDAEAMS